MHPWNRPKNTHFFLKAIHLPIMAASALLQWSSIDEPIHGPTNEWTNEQKAAAELQGCLLRLPRSSVVLQNGHRQRRSVDQHVHRQNHQPAGLRRTFNSRQKSLLESKQLTTSLSITNGRFFSTPIALLPFSTVRLIDGCALPACV